MFDKKGRVWLAAGVRGLDNPAFCKRGLRSSVGQGVPDRSLVAAGGGARSEDDEVHASSTPASGPITRSSATTPTTRCGSAAPARWPAGSTPRCSTRPATRRSRRAGRRSCSTSTATASSTSMSSRTRRPMPAKDKRIIPGSGPYAVMPHPTDGSIWYTVGVFGGAAGFLRFDPADRTVGSLQPAEGRLRHPRRRHRQERRRLGLGLERQSRQLRPPQVQGSAQRPECDRQSLPGGLDVLSLSRPELRRRDRPASRRATTPGSTSTTRSGWARTSRCPPPTSTTASLRSRTARWS